MMIIHGDADNYTPYEQGKKIYDCLHCQKAFYSAKGATHAQSLKTDPEKYYKEIESFISTIHLI